MPVAQPRRRAAPRLRKHARHVLQMAQAAAPPSTRPSHRLRRTAAGRRRPGSPACAASRRKRSGRVRGVGVGQMEAAEEERLVAGGGRVDLGLAEGDGVDSAEFKSEE